jgi:hypothetical protein
MSDETWHGAESPPAGAEHDDERIAPGYDAAEGDEGAVSLPPLRPGWEQTVDETVAAAAAEVIPRSPFDELPGSTASPGRPPDPDEIPHQFVPDPDMAGHCRRCGGWPGDTVHVQHDADLLSGAVDYRSRADEWAPQTGPDGTYNRPVVPGTGSSADALAGLAALTEPGGPRRDPVEDIGAGEAPPARRLADFQCSACGLTFKADEDTETCPRCSVGRLERLHVIIEADPTEAELREAGVINALGPYRQRLDDIWAEIASSLVTVLLAGRSAVDAWRRAGDVQAPMEAHEAMRRLAVVLGMAPDEHGRVAHPHGPHAELLQETAEMIRAEAGVISLHEDLRLQGAARRLRAHADFIARAVRDSGDGS